MIVTSAAYNVMAYKRNAQIPPPHPPHWIGARLSPEGPVMAMAIWAPPLDKTATLGNLTKEEEATDAEREKQLKNLMSPEEIAFEKDHLDVDFRDRFFKQIGRMRREYYKVRV